MIIALCFVVVCVVTPILAWNSGYNHGVKHGLSKQNDSPPTKPLLYTNGKLDRDEVKILLETAKELDDVTPLVDQFIEKAPQQAVHLCTASTNRENDAPCNEPATWRIIEKKGQRYFDYTYGEYRHKPARTLYLCNLHRTQWENSLCGIAVQEKI